MDILQLPISSDQTDIVTTEIAEKKSDGRLAREKICTGRPYENSYAISNPGSEYHLSVDKCGTRMLLRLK